MKGVQYTFSIPNYVATRAADKLPLRLLERGRVPGLKMVDRPRMPLPGADWLRVRPRMAGICGSDTSLLHGTSSPVLSPFVSFPAVLGHETIGEVIETGPGVTRVAAGDRIAIMPLINCEMRGLEDCPSCAIGQTGHCLNCAEGELSPGLMVGFCRDLPGGWSDDVVIHESQAFPIPMHISDETAVLIEPFSVALHAVLRNPPQPGAKVLIIGSGSIGLLVLAAMRMLGHRNDVTVLARRQIQERLALSFGATRVLTKKGALEAAEEFAGAKAYQPIVGGPTLTGGFDWIYDAVGNERSVKESLAVAGPLSQIVMVGCAGEIGKLDLTLVWASELKITGCYVYGTEPMLEDSPHTFDVALRLMAEHPDIKLSDMITHRFPLDRWRDAVAVSLARSTSGAIKVVFDMR